jgi:hypothetical protein
MVQNIKIRPYLPEEQNILVQSSFQYYARSATTKLNVKSYSCRSAAAQFPNKFIAKEAASPKQKFHLGLGTTRYNQGATRLEKIGNNKKLTCVVSFPCLQRICAGALFQGSLFVVKVACSLTGGRAPVSEL